MKIWETHGGWIKVQMTVDSGAVAIVWKKDTVPGVEVRRGAAQARGHMYTGANGKIIENEVCNGVN